MVPEDRNQVLLATGVRDDLAAPEVTARARELPFPAERAGEVGLRGHGCNPSRPTRCGLGDDAPRVDAQRRHLDHLRRTLSLALSNALGDKFHPHRRAVMRKIPTAPAAKFREEHIDLPIFMDIVTRMPPHSQAGAWVLLLTGPTIPYRVHGVRP
jgi:hypothetical protein